VKLLAASIDDARNGRRARPAIGARIPQPVDENGRTPTLWADCTAYVVDDDPAATVDDQDLIAAAAAGAGKLRAGDDTPAKVRARLTAEVAKAKTDREGGKKIGRTKPAPPADGGGKTKAGK
jgi:hypothetical protein